MVDSLVSVLWKTDSHEIDAWPECSFNELQEQVSVKQGYAVAASTVRSSIYQHSDLFERVRGDAGPVRWKLSDRARRAGDI